MRKSWRSDQYIDKAYVGPVRVTAKRVYLGGKGLENVFDRTTGRSLDAFNPHVRPWTLLRVLDTGWKVVLETEAERH